MQSCSQLKNCLFQSDCWGSTRAKHMYLYFVLLCLGNRSILPLSFRFISVAFGKSCDCFCARQTIRKDIMMTSSNGNIFRVTGPLCGGFTVIGEFPSQRPVTWNIDFFFICAWTNGWVNNRDGGDLRRHRAPYDVTGRMDKCTPWIHKKW